MKELSKLKKHLKHLFKSISLKRLFKDEFKSKLIDDYFIKNISIIRILEAGVGLDRFKFFNFYKDNKLYDFSFLEHRRDKFEYWGENISKNVKIIDNDIYRSNSTEIYNLVSLSFPTSQIKRFFSELLPRLLINQNGKGLYLLTIPISIEKNYFFELENNNKLGYKKFLEYVQSNVGQSFNKDILDLKKFFNNKNIEIIKICDPIYRPQRGYLYKTILLKLNKNYLSKFQNTYKNLNDKNKLLKIYSEIINDQTNNNDIYQNYLLKKKILRKSFNKISFLDAGVGLNRFKVINKFSEIEKFNFDFLENREEKYEYWDKNIKPEFNFIKNNVYDFKSYKKYDLINLSFSPKYIKLFCKKLFKKYQSNLSWNSFMILTLPLSINYRLYDDLRESSGFGFEDFKSFLKNDSFTIYKNEFNFYKFINEYDLEIIQAYDAINIPQKGYLYKTFFLKKRMFFRKKIIIFFQKTFNQLLISIPSTNQLKKLLSSINLLNKIKIIISNINLLNKIKIIISNINFPNKIKKLISNINFSNKIKKLVTNIQIFNKFHKFFKSHLTFASLINNVTYLFSFLLAFFVYLILFLKNHKLKFSQFIYNLKQVLINISSQTKYLLIIFLNSIRIFFRNIKSIYFSLKKYLHSFELKIYMRIIRKYFMNHDKLNVLNAGVGLKRYKCQRLLKGLIIRNNSFLEKRVDLHPYWLNKIDRNLNVISENVLNFKSNVKYDLIYLSFLPKNINYFFSTSIYNYYNMMHENSLIILTIPYQVLYSKIKEKDFKTYGEAEFKTFLEIKCKGKKSLNIINLIDKNKFTIYQTMPNIHKPQVGFKYKTLILKKRINKKISLNDSLTNRNYNLKRILNNNFFQDKIKNKQSKDNSSNKLKQNSSNKLLNIINNTWDLEFKNLNILDSGDSLERFKIINIFTKLKLKPISFYLIEQNENRFDYWRRKINFNFNLLPYNPYVFVTLQKYDVISLSFNPKKINLFFKKILFDYLFLLKEKSILIITIPVSIKGGSNKINSDNISFKGFEDFISSNKRFFDSNKKLNVDKLLKNLGFDFYEIFDSIYQPYPDFEFNTVVLNFNKKVKNELDFNKNISNSFTKIYPINFLNKGSRFSLYNYCNFLTKLKSEKRIVNIDDFYKNINIDPDKKEPLQLIKHDIHSDVISALKMAKAEKEIEVSSIYFAMHKSDHTKYLLDHSSYIDSLLNIQELGHEVGIHCDPIFLTINKLSALKEIVSFVNELRSCGLKIRLANTHGNTKHYFRFIGDTSNFSKYVKEGDNNFSKFQGGTNNDGYFCTSEMIFKEIYEQQEIVSDSNIENKSKGLVNSISLKQLMNEAGFDYWIDTSIYDKNLQKFNASTSISDTHKKIQLWGAYFITESKLFELDDESQDELLSQIKFDCAHLYHPQLYV